MSEPGRKKQRLSSRESDVSDSADKTLYSDLHALAGIIPKPTTPYRRAISAGPTPGSRNTPNIFNRTPGTAVRTPRGPSTRNVPARRQAPTTPHAIRALRERANAARTPGRRRSGRVQRETPRDTLRALSRTLAPVTRPIEPTPQTEHRSSRHPALDLADIEDGPDPVRPRLSMPLDDMYEDDSFHETAPRQSLLPDLPEDGDTYHSLEYGRRAFSEDHRGRLSGRISEHFGDMTELNMDGEEYEIDGTFINRRPGVDPDQLLDDIDEEMDDTGEIRALTGQRDGRRSDVDLGVFGEMDEPDEPTFRFTIPPPVRRVREEPEEENEQLDDTQLDEDAGAGAEQDEEDQDVDEDEHQDHDLGLDQTPDDEQTAAGPDLEPTGWESDPESTSDAELQAYREEASAIDRSLLSASPTQAGAQQPKKPRQRKEIYTSKFGLEYPGFPSAVVKRVATSLNKSQGRNAKISADTLKVLQQTTDWFFEQVSTSAAAYAEHAGRKGIEEADMITMMKRERLITKNTTAFYLAQKMLPGELLQNLRMQPVGKPKQQRQKRKRMDTIAEEEED